MSSRMKEANKATSSSKRPKAKLKQHEYVLLRDQASEKLMVVPIEEIISSKNREKLSSGDTVNHGTRGRRIRATITLIGKLSVTV